MKKFKFIFTLLICSSISYRATSQNLDCACLQASFETEIFNKQFFLNKHPQHEIILVDTSLWFKKCLLSKVHGRIIKIRHKRVLSNDPRYIIAYNLERQKDRLVLYFWRPYNGASVALGLTPSKTGKIYTDVVGYGAF